MSAAQTKPEIIETVKGLKEHLDQWQEGVERLEQEVYQLKKERQKPHQERIADLKERLHLLQVKLQAMAEGEPKEWQMARAGIYERIGQVKEAFDYAADQLALADDEVSLGWLQGFSEARTHESDGWAEGVGGRPEGSEGWAEGLGKRPSGSEGWAEGYEETQKR